jgi:tRNA pseudouridine13 synthase
VDSLPFLTAGLPGIGGRMKAQPDDFVVEELPLYQPSGEGQHTYVLLEKSGITTLEAVRLMAGALAVPPRAVGYAGQKDARAVTRQTISIDGVEPAQVEALALPGIEILSVSRHRNKLKLGHLAGNRFTIRVRAVPQNSLPLAEAVLAALSLRGVPNYFGQQRFGMRQNTHLLGWALLRGDDEDFVIEYLGRPHPGERPDSQAARAAIDAGDYDAALTQWPNNLREERRVLAALVRHNIDVSRAVQVVDRGMRRFYVSAYQSYLFNRLLAQRIQTFDRLEPGDVAFIHASGGAFVVQDPAAEQARADRFEISPSGPLFGSKLLQAEGLPGQREAAVLAESGLSLAEFRLPGAKLKGARRPFRVPLADMQVSWDDGLVLQFQLPPGSYATGVLREVMKND